MAHVEPTTTAHPARNAGGGVEYGFIPVVHIARLVVGAVITRRIGESSDWSQIVGDEVVSAALCDRINTTEVIGLIRAVADNVSGYGLALCHV